MIKYINSKKWENTDPEEIHVPMKMVGVANNVEPRLSNTQIFFRKYVFWEVKEKPPNALKTTISPHIIDQSDLKTPKNYWYGPPWFKNITKEEVVQKGYDKTEIKILNERYDKLIELLGEEPIGCARANNPVCDQYIRKVFSLQDELRKVGVDLYH